MSDEQPRGLAEFCKERGIDPTKLRLNLGIPEAIICFKFTGSFLYNLNQIDSPVFYDAANAALELKNAVVSKIPASMTKLKIKATVNTAKNRSVKSSSASTKVVRSASSGRIVLSPVKLGKISKATMVKAIITVKTASSKKKG